MRSRPDTALYSQLQLFHSALVRGRLTPCWWLVRGEAVNVHHQVQHVRQQGCACACELCRRGRQEAWEERRGSEWPQLGRLCPERDQRHETNTHRESTQEHGVVCGNAPLLHPSSTRRRVRKQHKWQQVGSNQEMLSVSLSLGSQKPENILNVLQGERNNSVTAIKRRAGVNGSPEIQLVQGLRESFDVRCREADIRKFGKIGRYVLNGVFAHGCSLFLPSLEKTRRGCDIPESPTDANTHLLFVCGHF
mmetsp:Transcript_13533/g.31150  ORF Transcript_13533/g.31150 Transcript_13533/m.31150 type:complete len:249 (-) Transcript_13533:414-1160(-)